MTNKEMIKTYRGALIAMFLVIGMAWMTTPAEAHEAVTVGVDNTNGVLIELCSAITNQAVTIHGYSTEQAQDLFDYCIKNAVANLMPKKFEHTHL